MAAEAAWLEIDAGALRHNIGVFRGVLGQGVRLGCVLKGNAYGHGFAQVLPVAHGWCDAIYLIDPRDGLAVRAFEKETGSPAREALGLGAGGADGAVGLARAGGDPGLSESGQ